MSAEPMILLDLNYTLVGNSGWRPGMPPMAERIALERYRRWIPAALTEAGVPVILITARNKRYQLQTLQHIRDLTGWSPDHWYFNDLGLQPHLWKRRCVLERIYPRFGDDPNGYYGLESNSSTRVEYAKLGIRATKIGDIPWQTPPWRNRPTTLSLNLGDPGSSTPT